MNKSWSQTPQKSHELWQTYAWYWRISKELVERESTEETYEALRQEVKAERDSGELPEEFEKLPIEKLRVALGGKPIGLNQRQQKEVIDETLVALDAYYASLLHSLKAAERTRTAADETLDTLLRSPE